MRISDWSSDVCSSDLSRHCRRAQHLLRLVSRRALDASKADRRQDRLGADLFARGHPHHRHVRREGPWPKDPPPGSSHLRSEEHTSELQSLMRISYTVFCLKKNTQYYYLTEPIVESK